MRPGARGDDSAVHQSRDGRHLERPAPLRDLARGRARGGRRDGRSRRDPGGRGAELRARAGFDVARIEEIEQVTQHDVIAFTTAVAEQVGPAARWLHFGLTSSDVVDTAQALQMRAGLRPDRQGPRRRCSTRSGHRAEEHRRTPMIGRTHGVHAEPMTLGVKLALWYAELQRDLDRVLRAREIVSVGKISGAVGMFAHLDPGDRGTGLRASRPAAGAGLVAGDSARPPRRAADRRWPSPRRRSRSSRSRSAACRRRRSARSRSRSARARRARRRCRTSATRSAASRSPAWRA